MSLPEQLKKKLTAKNMLLTIILVVPVAVLIAAFFSGTGNLKKRKAVNGRLDLSQWDFVKQGSVSLNGEWRFHWQELDSTTENINEAHDKGELLNVPGIWNGKGSRSFPAEGYGTYVLEVKLPEAKQMLALNIRTMSNASRIFINGKEHYSCGKVGTDAANSAPAYEPKVVSFVPDTNTLLICVQVSNFAHCKGGFWLPVDIGVPEKVQAAREGRALLEMFLFGCLFIMALYHFSLYFLRKSDTSTLYFGIMCAAISIRSLLTGENLINEIIRHPDWFLARRIEYLLTFISAPVYVTFSRTLYRKEWNNTIYKTIVWFGIALCAFVLVTPARIFTNTSYVFTGYAWLTSLYTITVFTKAARNRQEGAGIFLATSLFFLLTIVNDTLNQLEIVHTGLYLSFGLLIVTFAQSFVLSSRFATAFRNSEIYAATFRKFVPAQFLAKIAKDGIESIKAGNAEKEEVTVLFSDIRSFTTIAETMGPEEVFAMLNDYLSHVEPPVRGNAGFVDKYMGDGIMALFEDGNGHSSASNAVNAAISMQEALRVFNEKRSASGKTPLHMGIGLHTGPVIIGTLGGNERMDSTAIGDAVNLASRIEGMTKMYGVTLLASDETIRRLSTPEELLFRFVDRVMAKGKQEATAIWEIIGKKNNPALAQYAALLPVFHQSTNLYQAGRPEEAIKGFETWLAAFPGDLVASRYRDFCVQFIESGIDPHAGGITSQHIK